MTQLAEAANTSTPLNRRTIRAAQSSKLTQYGRAFVGLFRRDLHVLRRELFPFVIRVCMNPLLFLFVFTYVIPHMNSGAAMNPTASGYNEAGSGPAKMNDKYLAKLSGPLLDRIDIHVEVPAVPYKELTGKNVGTSSATMREQVAKAREVLGYEPVENWRKMKPAAKQ